MCRAVPWIPKSEMVSICRGLQVCLGFQRWVSGKNYSKLGIRRTSLAQLLAISSEGDLKVHGGSDRGEQRCRDGSMVAIETPKGNLFVLEPWAGTRLMQIKAVTCVFLFGLSFF